MTYQHDANGSVTSDGINTYGYDAAGRLRTAATGSYRYNGFGQRVQKVVTPVAAGLPVPSLSTTTLFVYDEAGHLIGEYDGSGNLIQETVWLDDLPLAVLKPEGNYYIHADHLGTPRQIDNQQQQAVWVWDTITFGDSIPNENPSGIGVPFKYSLRHPGQYYDAESGLFQNWWRDYSPSIGRYIESDPIGLDGGINTYAYASANPLSNQDLMGLQDNGQAGSTESSRMTLRCSKQCYTWEEFRCVVTYSLCRGPDSSRVPSPTPRRQRDDDDSDCLTTYLECSKEYEQCRRDCKLCTAVEP